jgi:hypothetical protein
MNRFALISGLAVLSVSAQATTLFHDGFESGDFSMWGGLTGSGTDPGSVQDTHVHSGAWAARMSGSTTTGVVNGRYANFSRAELAGEIIRFDFWMKLDAANNNNRHYAEVRSYSGDAFGVGGLEQIYAIGANNAAVVNGTFSGTRWHARIAFGSTAGWYQLNEAPIRNLEWNKFSIEVTDSTIQFFVNDVAGLAASIDRGNRGTLDSVVFGSRVSSANVDGYYDDFHVQVVPEPASMAALALGIGAVLARRRRNRS